LDHQHLPEADDGEKRGKRHASRQTTERYGGRRKHSANNDQQEGRYHNRDEPPAESNRMQIPLPAFSAGPL
jgi:hypothetical protein